MTVTAVILDSSPILWESGIGSDVMKPIAARRGRDDYIDHPCLDSAGAGLLLLDEAPRAAAWHFGKTTDGANINMAVAGDHPHCNPDHKP